MRYVAVLETPSVKKYVFGSDKLTEIRGASALLDHLNRNELPDILEPAEKVYANGGSGQFIFDMPQEEVVKKLKQAQKRYIDATNGGTTLVWGIAEYESEFSYQQSVSRAYADMHRRRFGGVNISHLIGMPLIKICESCRQNPVSKLEKYPERNWLCSVCAVKREYAHESKQIGVWKEFISFSKLDRQIKPAKTLADIKPKLALVYADGNAMGKRIRSLKSPEEYKLFSETVDNAIRKACFKGLRPVVEKNLTTEDIHVPTDILLLGGDDLVVVLPAEDALEFAYTVTTSFESKTQETLKKKVTLSIGVIVGGPTYPFPFMLDFAEQLLRSAKEKATSVDSEEPPSVVDFHIATSSNSLDIYTARNEYGLDCDEYKRTKRPYVVQDLELLFRIKRQLSESKFPKSRLNSLYNALFGTYKQAAYHTRKIWVTGRSNVRKKLTSILQQAGCFENMPWSAQKDTIITELVEFYDYLPENWSEEGNNA